MYRQRSTSGSRKAVNRDNKRSNSQNVNPAHLAKQTASSLAKQVDPTIRKKSASGNKTKPFLSRTASSKPGLS